MARFTWTRPGRKVAVADPPSALDRSTPAEPVIDTSDLSVLVRAFHMGEPPHPPAPTAVKPAMLTIVRAFPQDVQDRPIAIFVDDEPWGKVRYAQELTREVAPGRHRVRAFNTLFSQTLEIDVRPGEHVRLRCGNGFPRAGYLMMLFFHVTYLRVRLERDAGAP